MKKLSVLKEIQHIDSKQKSVLMYIHRERSKFKPNKSNEQQHSND